MLFLGINTKKKYASNLRCIINLIKTILIAYIQTKLIEQEHSDSN